MPKKFWLFFLYLALMVSTLAVFWQVHSFEFTNYDDPQYVSKNGHIYSGFTCDNIKWLFTKDVGRWHPLTGLTHMLDCRLFGLNAGRHHLTNLLLHIINTLLLFAVFRRATGAFWQSAFVAALFAIHPMHVESVAWISGRKDLLSALFWILTMGAYFRYVERHNVGWYVAAVAMFVLGLMAKPMLITLPFVLLLLDYWPLGRVDTDAAGKLKWHSASRLIWEKIPFFVLSVISCFVTFLIQRSIGAVGGMELFPLSTRIANAFVSYAKYIVKLFAPAHLAVFYPHFRTALPVWQIFASATVLPVLTILVIRFGSKYRYLPVGWFWYLGTLVPVIGLVQVGSHAMADRYTYVPLIGLFIIIAWGVSDLTAQWKYRKIVLSVSSLAIISVLSVYAWFQASYWRNSQTLFEHALKATYENQVTDNSLGMALMEQNKYDEAIKLFRRALALKPNYAEALNNLGFIYGQLGRQQEAIEAFKQAIKSNSNFAEPYYNLAVILCKLGQYQQAIDACRKSLEINPDYAKAQFELGLAYSGLGRNAEAIEVFNRAIQIKPDYARAYLLLGTVYSKLGRQPDAIKSIKQAISIDPNFAEAYYNISVIYGGLSQYQEVIEACRQAIKINPDYPEAYFNLGVAYVRLGRVPEAIDSYQHAIKIRPNYAQAHFNLILAYLSKGDKAAASEQYEILKRLDPQLAQKLLGYISK